MTLKNFIMKLNWRQVLMHVIAFWFFIYSFQTLSYLHNTKLIDTVRNSNGELTNRIFVNNRIVASDLTDFFLWKGISGFIGLFVAFIISLTISIRRQWFWVNALIALTATFFLYRFNLLGWRYLKQFFWYFGQ